MMKELRRELRDRDRGISLVQDWKVQTDTSEVGSQKHRKNTVACGERQNVDDLSELPDIFAKSRQRKGKNRRHSEPPRRLSQRTSIVPKVRGMHGATARADSTTLQRQRRAGHTGLEVELLESRRTKKISLTSRMMHNASMMSSSSIPKADLSQVKGHSRVLKRVSKTRSSVSSDTTRWEEMHDSERGMRRGMNCSPAFTLPGSGSLKRFKALRRIMTEVSLW